MNRKLDDFLLKFNKTKKQFDKSGYKWESLLKIADDYDDYKKGLLTVIAGIAKKFHVLPDTHSVRYRIKETDHVVEKILRKRIDDPKSKKLTVRNYKNNIYDFAGMRILHTYKNQWKGINDFILDNFEMSKMSPPTAFVAHDENQAPYKKGGLTIFPGRDIGYRSIHYLIWIPFKKGGSTKCNVEIQTRTIFEEGWSEIDHDIRYPYELDNELLKRSMKAFNTLARTADEMGSFAHYLREHSDINKRQGKELSSVKQLELKNKKLIKQLERRITEIEKKSPKEARAFRSDLMDYIENQESKSKLLFVPTLPKLFSSFVDSRSRKK